MTVTSVKLVLVKLSWTKVYGEVSLKQVRRGRKKGRNVSNNEQEQ